ncbi:MAG: integrase catalytic domain-containing protein [Candidatus Bathyarchaeia archaeon]
MEMDDNDDYRYMLTVIDHFSNFGFAFPLFSKTAEEVAIHLHTLFLVFGPPIYLHSDNGGEFVNALITVLLDKYKIEVGYSSCTQELNIERPVMVKHTIRGNKGKLRSLMVQLQLCWRRKYTNWVQSMLVFVQAIVVNVVVRRWIDLLDEVLFSYRITRQETTGISPFKVMFGREVSFYSLNKKKPSIQFLMLNNEVCRNSPINSLLAEIMKLVRTKQDVVIKKMKRQWDTVNTIVSTFYYFKLNQKGI